MKALAVTTGEPGGIGPEISLSLASSSHPNPIVLIGDRNLLASRDRTTGNRLELVDVRLDALPKEPAENGRCYVCHVPLRAKASAGSLDRENAHYVLDTIGIAATGCLDGSFAGMVTAPVHKGIINDAGVEFSGHTELLAELAGGVQPVMLLVGGGLRVALLTTHLPLRAVSQNITKDKIEHMVAVLTHGLETQFAVSQAKIMVLGLNPHAGEQGYLGDEEIQIITPALESLRMRGYNVIGPVPADTGFTHERLLNVDAVLAMYHDQGLPVLKHASFGEAVNVTLGLPFVRTSVDHGTALDIAGKGIASSSSMHAAAALAVRLCECMEADAHTRRITKAVDESPQNFGAKARR